MKILLFLFGLLLLLSFNAFKPKPNNIVKQPIPTSDTALIQPKFITKQALFPAFINYLKTQPSSVFQ
jgi:hypothetical protein